MNENKTNINYYPGHMAKTKRQILENMDLIDIVYEVLDARCPWSTKIKEIDDIIKNKVKILIMTKKDLCDISKTTEWIEFYKNKGYDVLCIDLKNNNDFKKIYSLTNEKTRYIQEKRQKKGLRPKEIKALVVGTPNVGKSTLINNMIGKKAQNVGNTPGVTKNLNFLPTKYGITLLDTPGILWPKLDDEIIAFNLASIGSIKKDVLNINDVSKYILNIYVNKYPNILKEYYSCDMIDIEEIYTFLAGKWNYFYNNEVDYIKVSERIYNDFISGKIKGITLDEK